MRALPRSSAALSRARPSYSSSPAPLAPWPRPRRTCGPTAVPLSLALTHEVMELGACHVPAALLHGFARLQHSHYDAECCNSVTYIARQELGTQALAACRTRVLALRASRASRCSGARVVGATMGDAGMMPQLSPVPLGRCRGPWRERQHRTVPTASAAFFGCVRVCNRWGCNEPEGIQGDPTDLAEPRD